MKTAPLLLLLLLDAVLGGPRQARVTFIPLSKVAYLQARKDLAITKPNHTHPVKKQAGRLVIPTIAGPKVLADVVIDAAALATGHREAEAVQYNYVGYFPIFNNHLIRVQYYEFAKWLLIDNSGRQLSLWGEPIFSPDQHRIFAICEGLEAGKGRPNSLQMLEMQNGALREVWSQKPKKWRPYRAYWASPQSLLLVREMWTGKIPSDTYTYAKLLIQ